MAAILSSISSSPLAAARVAPLLIAAVTLACTTTAQADGSVTTSCVGIRGAATCTTIWKRGLGDSVEPALWTSRCRPVADFDDYGVKRYRYAAAGCEFGRYE